MSADYTARLNRVLDHIECHLDQDLHLNDLAVVANFSPFHFHRLFHAMMGETTREFILRLRLEKASTWLIAYPHKPVNEIAHDCGFSGLSTFSRVFRRTFGVSASDWRRGRRKPGQMLRNPGKTPGNPCEINLRSSMYIDPRTHQPAWRITMSDDLSAQVEIHDRPAQRVAYVRHLGPYAGQEQLFQGLFHKLMAWAGPRGLIRFPQTQLLTIYHDDPNLTDERKLRLSACMTVPSDTEGEGEVGVLDLPAGRYAQARFEIRADQYGEAWDALYGGWLPTSGYVPDDRPCFELYHNDPTTHPQGKHIITICVPVKAG
ncbi:MAG: AraC family transcriptional regulator [Candidatus Zixiibacteriota bacterium]|nr:MAG: AraC family transcriptional regulator [candidate division Zixibacteria bacterium]